VIFRTRLIVKASRSNGSLSYDKHQ
jgi:hypothetical protein